MAPRPTALTIAVFAALVAADAILSAGILVADPITMNLWDEAEFIHRGRQLAHGVWPSLAHNPLTAALYTAPAALTRGASWMIDACTAGRFLLFAALWVAVVLIAWELRDRAPPTLTGLVFFLTPVLPDVLRNPSDALFAAASAFAFLFLYVSRAADRFAPRFFRAPSWRSAPSRVSTAFLCFSFSRYS
ncbi:MAG: hypothetical protein M5R36_11600 [Deltaproteobacteria bacterium]|nr:hypothetical protein [Deltaproteobacteria bacterium]